MKLRTIPLLLISSLSASHALAGSITDINVSSLPDNQKVIKIRFDTNPITPNGFITSAPNRISLDFADTDIKLSQPLLEYADPLLTQINAVQDQNKSRIVLSLNQAGQYNAQVKGNETWIYISPSDNNPPPAPTRTTAITATAPAQYAPSYQTTPISAPRPSENITSTSIDFRKSRNNSGIVELAASNFSDGPDIKKQGNKLIVTLKNYILPTQAQRSLNVADFNTPVQSVTLKRNRNDTQLIISNRSNWQYTSRQSADRYYFEISPQSMTLADRSTGSSANKSFRGKRISLDFQDIDVRTILQILAKESGTNIVASDSVTGKMTLTLKDVPWDQALDLVMQARNLDMRRQGNIINIAPREELLAKDKSMLQAQKEIDELGPLFSQTFQLKYKNVEEFRKILRLDETSSSTTSSGNNANRNTLLSSRGSVLIDSATNTLIVNDNTRVIQKFQKLIDELDVPTRQVMVEARIVEANDGFSRDLGVKFGYQGVRGSNSWGSSWSDAYSNQNTTNNFTFNPNVNLPVSSATSSIALVHSIASGALGLEISAMQEQSKGKIISNPRVLTQDRKEAVIESGREIPYEESTSSGATSITFKKAVLGLTVTPNITPDGQIIMNVKINKDSPVSCTSNGQETLCIDTKRLQTQAMVEDGGTLIVGGIYEEENSNTLNKVPLLGDIPIIGNLFKSRVRSETRRELLIFITPRIMDGVGNNLRY